MTKGCNPILFTRSFLISRHLLQFFSSRMAFMKKSSSSIRVKVAKELPAIFNFPSQNLTFQTRWGKQTYPSTFTNAEKFSIAYLLRTCMSSKTRNNIIHIHHLGVIAILLLVKMFYYLYYQPFFTKSSSHYHQHPMPNLPPKDPK